MQLDHDNLYQAKLIVSVLSRGLANEIVEEMYAQKKIIATEALAVRNQHSLMLPNDWVEMDMLKVVVLPQYADHVFQFIYEHAKVDEIEGSYMFQMNVPWSTHFELPDPDTLNPASKQEEEAS